MSEADSQSPGRADDQLTIRARNIGTDPAYSSPSFVSPNGDVAWGASGLTKRELFAAMAMEGILASETVNRHSPAIEQLASTAVAYADALLKELAR